MKFANISARHFGNAFVAERVLFEVFDKRSDNLILNFFDVVFSHAGCLLIFVFNDAVSKELRISENGFIRAVCRDFRFRGVILSVIAVFFAAAQMQTFESELHPPPPNG
jgi:hypothetical protein